jgi:hypothetical protein
MYLFGVNVDRALSGFGSIPTAPDKALIFNMEICLIRYSSFRKKQRFNVLTINRYRKLTS